MLTLVQTRRDYDRLIRDAGDSALGFLGGLSGLAGEMKLTKSRLDVLAGVTGTLFFEVTGDEGFAILTHFGESAAKEQPDTDDPRRTPRSTPSSARASSTPRTPSWAASSRSRATCSSRCRSPSPPWRRTEGTD